MFLWRWWSEAVKTAYSRNFHLLRIHVTAYWRPGIFCGRECTLAMFWGAISSAHISLIRFCAGSYSTLIARCRSGSPCPSSTWNGILHRTQHPLVCLTNFFFSWSFLKSQFKHCSPWKSSSISSLCPFPWTSVCCSTCGCLHAQLPVRGSYLSISRILWT